MSAENPFDTFNPNWFPRARRVTEIMKGWVSTFVMPTEAPDYMSNHYDPLASPVRPVTGWPPAAPWSEGTQPPHQSWEEYQATGRGILDHSNVIAFPVNQMVGPEDPEAA